MIVPTTYDERVKSLNPLWTEMKGRQEDQVNRLCGG